MPLFPSVPDVSGVPILLRDPTAFLSQIPLLTSDTINQFGQLSAPRWGLFKGGAPFVVSDNVVAVDYRQEWSLLNYPVEEGAFQTYNKVSSPFDVRLRVSTGGSEQDKNNMLTSIENAGASLELFSIVTPEKTYPSVNVMHYDYRRTSYDGIGLLIVDIWCMEVRVSAKAEFSQTKSASGADTVNTGTVATDSATDQQDSQIPGVQ